MLFSGVREYVQEETIYFCSLNTQVNVWQETRYKLCCSAVFRGSPLFGFPNFMYKGVSRGKQFQTLNVWWCAELLRRMFESILADTS